MSAQASNDNSRSHAVRTDWRSFSDRLRRGPSSPSAAARNSCWVTYSRESSEVNTKPISFRKGRVCRNSG